jgi:hypothetical protein
LLTARYISRIFTCFISETRWLSGLNRSHIKYCVMFFSMVLNACKYPGFNSYLKHAQYLRCWLRHFRVTQVSFCWVTPWSDFDLYRATKPYCSCSQRLSSMHSPAWSLRVGVGSANKLHFLQIFFLFIFQFLFLFFFPNFFKYLFSIFLIIFFLYIFFLCVWKRFFWRKGGHIIILAWERVNKIFF